MPWKRKRPGRSGAFGTVRLFVVSLLLLAALGRRVFRENRTEHDSGAHAASAGGIGAHRRAGPVKRAGVASAEGRSELLDTARRAVDERREHQLVAAGGDAADVGLVIGDGDSSGGGGDRNGSHVLARRRREVQRAGGRGKLGDGGRAGANRGLRVRGERETFRNARTDRVVLIRRQRNRRQNTDDRHYDHQFDQRETLLKRFHV